MDGAQDLRQQRWLSSYKTVNNVFTLESDHGLGLRSAGGGDSGQKQGLEWAAETPTPGVTSPGLKPPL